MKKISKGVFAKHLQQIMSLKTKKEKAGDSVGYFKQRAIN